MSTFLDLVNKVIVESGSELDELTVGTWSSAEAGRRLYPRIKRLVAEAWKLIQMKHNAWEFKAAELTIPVYAKIKFQNGFRAAGEPPVGAVFIGATSGFSLPIRAVDTVDGSWTLGTASGQITLGDGFVGNQLVPGEVFDEQSPISMDGFFDYLEKGSYDFSENDPLFSEMSWETMVAYRDGSTPIPVRYMPWDNWTYEDASFTQGSLSPPAYFSQDPFGKIVFYPQTLDTFTVNFVYTRGPQVLSDPDDVPVGLRSSLHDWIAWNALMNLALYDKNPDLYSYARTMANPYQYAAERDEAPLISWGASKFNRER